jgi:hypothetical protein
MYVCIYIYIYSLSLTHTHIYTEQQIVTSFLCISILTFLDWKRTIQYCKLNNSMHFMNIICCSLCLKYNFAFTILCVPVLIGKLLPLNERYRHRYKIFVKQIDEHTVFL